LTRNRSGWPETYPEFGTGKTAAGDQWGTTRVSRSALPSVNQHDHHYIDQLLTCVDVKRNVLGVKCAANSYGPEGGGGPV